MRYTYTDAKTGLQENVDPEKWRWEVEYTSGAQMRQFGDDGVFHKFAEVDQTQPLVFRMYSLETDHIFSILFDPKTMKNLFHMYRNTVFNAGTPQEIRERMYVFGYNVVGVTLYHVIIPYNELVITDNLDRIEVIPSK